MAELAPVTEEVFETKRKDMAAADASAMSEVVYKCVPCNKIFKTLEQLNEHKKSKKHKKAQKEYEANNPNASKSSIFLSINQSTPSEVSYQSQDHIPRGNILDELKNNLKDNKETIEEKQRAEADARFAEAGEEGAEKQGKKRTALDSARCCLFCDKEFGGVKECLDHMRLRHSFVLLDIDCLVDLRGLLGYMAQRIQLGHLCLFCGKQFRDAKSC